MLRELLEEIVAVLNTPPVASVSASWSYLQFWNLALQDPDVCVVAPVSLALERTSRDRFDYRASVEAIRARTRRNASDIEQTLAETIAIIDRLADRPVLTRGGFTFALLLLEIEEPIYSIDETIDEKSVVYTTVRATYYVTQR